MTAPGAVLGCLMLFLVPTMGTAAGKGSAKAPPAPAPLCTVDRKSHTAKHLGTRHALVKGGVPSQADLSKMWADHGSEIGCLLEATGLGELEAALQTAATDGSATERDLSADECFDWMSWRVKGKVKAGPLCLETGGRKTYRIFELHPKTESMVSETKPDPRCEISASGSLEAMKITVDVTGSSPGAAATWSRSDGQQGDLSGAGPRFEVEWKCPDLCKNDYTFTVKAGDQGKQTWAIDTYDFIVPQICGNLSYEAKGKTSGQEVRPGASAECTKSAIVRKTFPLAPAPALSIEPSEVRTRRPFKKVEATATSVCLQSLVTELHGGGRRGAQLKEYDEALKQNPTSTFSIRKPGQYSFVAIATDQCGQQTVTESLVLVKPRWTVRGFGAWIDPKDEAIHTERTLAGNTRESTSYNLRRGEGIGASAEYHASDRVGIEGGILFGRVDTLFMKDLGNGWAQQKKEVMVTSLTVGPNFHLLGATPGRPDLFLGPFVSWWSFQGKTYQPIGAADRRSLQSAIGFGAQVGYDLPFKRSPQWALHLGARYEKLAPDLKLSTGGKTGIDVDPLTLAAGVAFSF